MSNNNFLNFIIIGTQKAGTTWLSRRLNEHPEIFLPPNELHYFDLDQNYKKGLDWYRKQFNDKPKDAKSVGEKTPDYLWTNRPHQNKINIAERIHQLDPDLKLIIILRNPVKRAISAYNHFLRNGWINFKENPDNY